MSFAQTIIQGNIGKQVELQYTQGGAAVAEFSVAVTKKFNDQEKTNWYPVKAFKGTAETIAKFFGKGDPILLVGEMNFFDYEKDGRTIYGYELIATSFSFCGKPGGSIRQQANPQNQSGYTPQGSGFNNHNQRGQTGYAQHDAGFTPQPDGDIPF